MDPEHTAPGIADPFVTFSGIQILARLRSLGFSFNDYEGRAAHSASAVGSHAHCKDDAQAALKSRT